MLHHCNVNILFIALSTVLILPCIRTLRNLYLSSSLTSKRVTVPGAISWVQKGEHTQRKRLGETVNFTYCSQAILNFGASKLLQVELCNRIVFVDFGATSRTSSKWNNVITSYNTTSLPLKLIMCRWLRLKMKEFEFGFTNNVNSYIVNW